MFKENIGIVFKGDCEDCNYKRLEAKAIAYYLCRDLLEDIHAAGKITDREMRLINKQATNRAAKLLEILKNPDERRALLVYALMYCLDWDDAEDEVLYNILKAHGQAINEEYEEYKKEKNVG